MSGIYLQPKRVEEFFRSARRRYDLHLKRSAGLPPPWTEDPVLAQWRFCNVFREDDRTTKWVAEHLREPLRESPHVLVAMAAARFFNRVETLEKVEDLLVEGWDSVEARRRLRGVEPIVGGAYIVKTPNGMSKLDGVCWILDRLLPDAVDLATRVVPGQETLQAFWEKLRRYPYFGPFMAYEVVSDLRHTYLLQDAPDVNSWACAGPGCAKGLSFLVAGRFKVFYHNNAAGQRAMLLLMRELLSVSREPEYWPHDWPAWEMREVEHWLCEYAKWVTATHFRQKLKRRFTC